MLATRLERGALHAIHAVFLELRAMAYRGETHERLARALDAAEELPTLMLRHDDTTSEFRSALEGLVQLNPDFRHALKKFEQGGVGG